MFKRLRHVPLLLLAVLVLSAESCPQNAPDCLKFPTDHLILVDADGIVSLPEAHISMLNQIVWMHVSPKKSTLSIRFKVPDGKKPPFDGMKPDGYVPLCFQQYVESPPPGFTLSLCVSGPVAADASRNYPYEYEQVITAAGKPVVKDAHIIIQP